MRKAAEDKHHPGSTGTDHVVDLLVAKLELKNCATSMLSPVISGSLKGVMTK
jgi:hypothetical protein